MPVREEKMAALLHSRCRVQENGVQVLEFGFLILGERR